MKQPSFASRAYDGKKKQTRKEIFLAEMDRIIPWRKLTRLIELGQDPVPDESTSLSSVTCWRNTTWRQSRLRPPAAIWRETI